MTPEKILAQAAAEVGYKESGTNYTKYGAWYGLDGQAWCMMFVQWVFHVCGMDLPYRSASCANTLSWWKKNKPGSVYSTPAVGDIVIYDGHTGIVETVTSATTFETIEGNYSDQVKRVKRKLSEALAFLRPDYKPEVKEPEIREEPEIKDAPVPDTKEEKKVVYNVDNLPSWAVKEINLCQSFGILRGDGTGLNLSEDMLRVYVSMGRILEQFDERISALEDKDYI